MPTLAVAEASNAAFFPSYIPVAVVVGGTSGVGQAMAEALARQLNGRAHIIIIGRNPTTAAKILATFPKPNEPDGWTHEFVPCDGLSMASVRAVCAGLIARLMRINFLIITAGGPAGNSMVDSYATPEGLDAHLAMRYFMRYLFTRELLPLLVSAKAMGQHAHVMTVLGAGFGISIRTTDLGLHETRSRSIKLLKGILPVLPCSLQGGLSGVGYNDALVAHFAAQHPELAFTHINPGQVLTAGGSDVDLGWLLTPLAAISLSQDDRAQHMLYALLDVERGMFIRGDHGDVVGAHVFQPDHKVHFDLTSPTAHKTGFLHGVPIKGYGASDAGVAGLIAYTEQVLAAIPIPGPVPSES
ncbi:hypothetical protein B0H13DRAFT_2060735 [Mycena leptocephala]|nr:hypothetical protein B0H13DRAFT_2060735 [Mycena leptocephala]